jgi:CBS domain-containing protein
MNIYNILETKGFDVWSISPDATVFESLKIMANRGVGALVVLENDHLVGVLSERDYARKVALLERSSKTTTVREIMTPKVVTIHAGQTLRECMELMNKNHIRHIPVVDDKEKVVGVVSIGDVVNRIIYEQKESIKNLEKRFLDKDIES